MKITPRDVVKAIPKYRSMFSGDHDILPPAFSLRDFLPPVADQGSQGSCVSFAATYYGKGLQEELKRGWSNDVREHQFSPAFTHNLTRVYGRTCQDGATLPGVLNILKEQGAPTWASMPYYEHGACDAQPTAEQYGEAGLYRIRNYSAVFYMYSSDGTVSPDDEQIEQIKRILASSKPIVTGLYMPQAFFGLKEPDLGSLLRQYDEHAEPHAVLMIGYDDGFGPNGAFEFVNSWGAEFGDDGRFWIDYGLIQQEAVFIELYVMEDGIADSLVVGAGGPVVVSVGEAARLLAWADGGDPPYDFRWTMPDGSAALYLDDPDAMQPICTPQESVWYKLTVTDASGHETTAVTEIVVEITDDNTELDEVDPEPEEDSEPGPLSMQAPVYTITRQGEPDACLLSQAVFLRPQPSGGEPPYSWLWTDMDGNEVGWEDVLIIDTCDIRTEQYTITLADFAGERIERAITVAVVGETE